MIEDDGKFFCCEGCRGVYHLLKSEGLDSFYDKLGNTKLNPAKRIEDNIEKFDLEGFKKRYVKQRDDGLNEINLIIEGIHCAACVWLNEKVLHKTKGVIEADINYSNNKAKVVWDESEIKLSEIIKAIRNIGYNAYPYDPTLQEERTLKAKRDYYMRILVAVFATMNIMWIAIAQYVGFFTGMRRDIKDILNFAEFILATPTLFYSGQVFFKGAYYGLKNRFINMDFLVATGATLVYLYSIWAMITKQGEVYFDSVTMIITFVLVGKYLEVLSKKQAVDTIDSLLGSYPTEVVVVKDGKKSLVSLENVEVGDIIEIKSGDKVVIDGVVVSGEGSFDESSLTGESRAVYKKVGDEVISGSILLDTVIRYKAINTFDNSTISKIAKLLEESIVKKPKIERLANRISGYFSLIILILAILTFILWYWYIGEFEKALIVSVSLIVIACPCALGLATPMATLVGIGEAAKRGILFKEASFLESMAKANTLVLDKTGTVTKGKPAVENVKKFLEFDENILYTLVKASNHLVSKGILEYLRKRGVDREYEINSFKEIKAKGIKAVINNKVVVGGNIEFLKEEGIAIDYDTENTIFALAIDNQLTAIFELVDEIKEGAALAISKLRKLSIDIIMLTGDNEKVAKKVAKELGIKRFKANMLPLDKAKFIDKLHQDKKVVIMAGDGINDSLALARSDIAIAMGSGADVALSVSDVVLLDEKPIKIYEALLISKRVYRAIKENLALSLFYNSIAIPLAMMGYVNPLFAALAMSLSSLSVVGNSMRIKLFKGK
jgi:Cu+-exporting ATPase